MSDTITAKRRLVVAAGWGVVATLAMTAVMLLGVGSGMSPMPDPIPAALVTHTLGALPQPATLGLAVLVHLTYGAGAAVVLAAVSSRVTVWAGAGFGGLLWVLMGVLWLPYLGWGPFGTAVTAKIALATLLLHLVYGITLGLLLDRDSRHPIAHG
jgi:uncharacterized membrane protein YagU involved in acid resistance